MSHRLPGASEPRPDRPATTAYLERMAACAAHLGRVLAPVSEKHRLSRLFESDAERVIRGLGNGLLSIVGNYLRTQDPRQATAWMVEGDPAHLCWEYLPHAAAYVELVDELHYPLGSVRFETPESEVGMSLDLVVLDAHGYPVVLGEVKTEAAQINRLAEGVREHVADPGKPPPASRGGPQGIRREAWKLAHQLWGTRAPWLWLVGAGSRAAYQVTYGDGLSLGQVDALPTATDVTVVFAEDWPAIRLP